MDGILARAEDGRNGDVAARHGEGGGIVGVPCAVCHYISAIPIGYRDSVEDIAFLRVSTDGDGLARMGSGDCIAIHRDTDVAACDVTCFVDIKGL